MIESVVRAGLRREASRLRLLSAATAQFSHLSHVLCRKVTPAGFGYAVKFYHQSQRRNDANVNPQGIV
jgi:hypothetical protein